MAPEIEQPDDPSAADPADVIAADTFLRTLVRFAGDAVTVKDLEGRFLLVSESVAAAFGRSPQELVGQRDVDVMPPEAAARTREMDREVVAAGKPLRFDETLELWRPGERTTDVLHASIIKFPYYAEDGRLLAIVGISRDMTPYKRLEAQLAEAERIAGLGSWTHDVASGESSWSENLYRLLQLDPATTTPGVAAMLTRIRPTEREGFQRHFERALAGDEPLAMDYAVVLPGGQVRMLHSRGRVLRTPDGQPYRVVGTVQDVTEAHAAERAMARGNALLRALMDTSEEGMLVVDENMAIISHNRRFRDLFGVPEALLTAGEDPPVLAFVQAQVADPEGFRARVDALYADPLASGHDEVPLRDGRVIARYSTPLVAHDAVSYGRVWFFRDVSARKQLEDALRAQNERLRELSDLKTTFVNTVSHDLRTPLTAVIGYAEFLEDGMGGELTEVQAGYVAEIVRSAKRLEGMVDDLLDVARLEAGLFALRRAERDVVGVAEGVIATFRPLAETMEAALALEAPARPLLAEVDGARLERVFANLIGNALRFTPRGGQVRVRVRDAGERLRVEVVDEGPGIAPVDRPKLFRRFGQLSGRSRGSTGLGLFISRTIIEAHGGVIDVDSVPGAGATFWFELPRRSG